MLPKKDREIISKIGRYQYNKMKELNLGYEQFLEYQNNKQKEKELKKKIGYGEFNKMKELGLDYEEYKQYQKEQKFKKYERKREKDRIRFRTVRYIERYCDIEMKCQVCNTDKNVQIHHPNYRDYLKINLLCKRHHDELHRFELVPPQIIDLEKISVKKPPLKERKDYINSNVEAMIEDVLKNDFTYTDLYKKYCIAGTTIKRYFSKRGDYQMLEKKIKENAKKRYSQRKNIHTENPLLSYKKENCLTSKDLSKITGIPLPTIRAIEIGKTNLENAREITRQKLKKIGVQ